MIGRTVRIDACVRAPLVLLLLVLLVQWGGAASVPPGPVITVTVGGHQIRAELAATPDQRQRGLMGRAGLAVDEGMLFIYADDMPGLWYWMKDTPTPLDIAFIDKAYHIINTAEMTPFDATTHYTTAAPCRYVLEVAQGWFARHGVRPGATVRFILPTDLQIR